MKREELIKLLSEYATVDQWNNIADHTLREMGAPDWQVVHSEVYNFFSPSVGQSVMLENVFPEALKPPVKVHGCITEEPSQGEDSGGSVEYYKCPIRLETTEGLQDNLAGDVKYIAECNDLIETLGMTPAEANIFKEVWRSAAARTLGKKKAGHTEIRGAEKIVFFGKRNLVQKGGK